MGGRSAGGRPSDGNCGAVSAGVEESGTAVDDDDGNLGDGGGWGEPSSAARTTVRCKPRVDLNAGDG
jgi:hypothetical protein